MTVRTVGASELEELRDQWTDLYRLQHEMGMLVELPPNAFDLWVRSLEKSLGRFANVFVGRVDGSFAGFVACRLRTLPAYFGSEMVGFVSDVYVASEMRGKGIAERLLAAAQEWCEAEGVARMELQVITGNDLALRAYEKLGWQAELRQMVRMTRLDGRAGPDRQIQSRRRKP